jgi:hypothetical protein
MKVQTILDFMAKIEESITAFAATYEALLGNGTDVRPYLKRPAVSENGCRNGSLHLKTHWKLSCLALAVCAVASAAPLALDPANPHYFLLDGKPTVLVTSGEHYGSVINSDFNYSRYLDELARNHLNLTRIWVGPYREVAGSFKISGNTLAPKPISFLPPWPRSNVPGAADGGNRFDLSRWNPAYFARLHDFIGQAARRGVVVEVNLFCPYYEEPLWKVSPLNSLNNMNGVGDVPSIEVLTMKHPDLLTIEDAMVRKIVTELNGFDNLYYEICNEPYFGGVTLEWQRHIAGLIRRTEQAQAKRHLISQNISNGSKRVEDADPNVSIFNFHYSHPPESVAMNYELQRVIGNNETGFDGQADATYRIQGWNFLTAGGGLYNNLDYSFAVGHEDGTFHYDAATPGGGSPALRNQLGVLLAFFNSLDLDHLRPNDALAKSAEPHPPGLRAIAVPGRDYVVYVYRSHIDPKAKPKYVVDSAVHRDKVSVDLPSGDYEQYWLNTRTGAAEGRQHFHHSGGERTFESPTYSEDVVLRIHKADSHLPQ